MMRLLWCVFFIHLYLDDIQTHVNDMLSTGAVVSGSGVTFEGITEVTTVQVMVSQVIMASPEIKDTCRVKDSQFTALVTTRS